MQTWKHTLVAGTVSTLALSAVSSAAFAILPSLELSVEPSASRIDVDIANGPIREDSGAFRVSASIQELRDVIARQAVQKRLSDRNGFYTATRGFDNATLTVEVTDSQGKRDYSYPIESLDQDDFAETYKVAGFLKGVRIGIDGEGEYLKCFDEDTCVVEDIWAKRVGGFFSEAARLVKYDQAFSCADDQLIVSRRISDANELQLEINSSDAVAWFGFSSGKRTINAAPFADYQDYAGSSEIRDFPQHAGKFREFKTSVVAGGFKLEQITEPHYICTYSTFTSYPTTYRVPTPIGERCADIYRGSTVGDRPGIDQVETKDWFFPGCKNI